MDLLHELRVLQMQALVQYGIESPTHMTLVAAQTRIATLEAEVEALRLELAGLPPVNDSHDCGDDPLLCSCRDAKERT